MTIDWFAVSCVGSTPFTFMLSRYLTRPKAVENKQDSNVYTVGPSTKFEVRHDQCRRCGARVPKGHRMCKPCNQIAAQRNTGESVDSRRFDMSPGETVPLSTILSNLRLYGTIAEDPNNKWDSHIDYLKSCQEVMQKQIKDMERAIKATVETIENGGIGKEDIALLREQLSEMTFAATQLEDKMEHAKTQAAKFVDWGDSDIIRG